ncbi:TAXI family TRAP transporter solute-binding subunit [Salipaludibacillus sp. CF4.18]|uniref:TAXI family TRAP transporter solute-binding subunit n=1 Tax=Salipaludibacillus sp. CF4.18 TaxID=3373081 RepID=UPI003EE44B07
MNRKRLHNLSIFLLLTVMAVIFAACNSEQSESGGNGSEGELSGSVPVYTSGSGGILYILNAGISNIFNTNDLMPGVQLVTEATSGSTEVMTLTLERAASGRAALGANSAPSVYKLYEGTEEHIPGEHPDIRGIANLGYAAVHVLVRKDSSFETFADLEGKRIGASPGSAPELFLKELLSAGYGLEESDYNMLPLGYQEVQEGLQNRSIDAGIVMGSIPAPLVNEAASMTDVRILTVEEDVQEKFLEVYPFYDFRTVESDTYAGQDTDVSIGSLDLLMFTHKDTSEELVYNYVKSILDYQDQFHGLHPSASAINEDTINEGIQIPLHSGAEKYYKEIGILE